MKNGSLISVAFVLLIVLVLLTLFGIMYVYLTTKSKERLALIEKGMDPNLANSDFWVQIGIIFGSASLGLVAGDKIPGGYGPLIGIILAGAALVFYNMYKRKTSRK